MIGAITGLFVWIPGFTRQAVNAAKGEFVAQPRFVGLVVGVALWPMLANVGSGRVIENHPNRVPILFLVVFEQTLLDLFDVSFQFVKHIKGQRKSLVYSAARLALQQCQLALFVRL